MKGLKLYRLYVMSAIALLASACGSGTTDAGADGSQEEEELCHNIVYGIVADDYRLIRDEIRPGETVGAILGRYGVSAADVDRLDRKSRDVFPLRNIRAGQSYTVFIHEDSLNVPHADHFVYERNKTEYVVFSFVGDSVTVTPGEREMRIVRRKSSAAIESSLWGAIIRENLSFALAAEMEEIYQWSVDFAGIQKGDSFTVIYDEKYVDSVQVGIGRIWGAKFTHNGRDYYAIPFKQDGRISYWEYDGGSLRKQLLKAPLKFTRISSRFSNARLHPVHKVYRPHYGVDYAAPKGTPVHAVADGVVTFKGWGGGGGNTIKIKHPGNLMTGYLHLNGFAKGIVQGSRVTQGQLIGYVGSTGTSTGPHLDYRIWKNGKPIDPLKVPQESAEPIAKANRQLFEFVREQVVAELEGEVADSLKIMQVDSVVLPSWYRPAAGQNGDTGSSGNVTDSDAKTAAKR